MNISILDSKNGYKLIKDTTFPGETIFSILNPDNAIIGEAKNEILVREAWDKNKEKFV